MSLKKTSRLGSIRDRSDCQSARRRWRTYATLAVLALVSLASARWQDAKPMLYRELQSVASGQRVKDQTSDKSVALLDITASVGLPGGLQDLLIASNDDSLAGLVDLHILQLTKPLEAAPAAQILDSLQTGPLSIARAFVADLCRGLERVQYDGRGPDLSCGWRLMYERLPPEQQEMDYSVLTDLNLYTEPRGTADEHVHTVYRQVRSVLERLLPPTSPQLQVYRLIQHGSELDTVYTVLYAPLKGQVALIRYRTLSFDTQLSGARPTYDEGEGESDPESAGHAKIF